MNERIIQLRRAAKVVLFVLLLSIAGMTKAQTENITFADANVKAICVANWDTDGDGELNTPEAAAVTNLGTYFKSTAITAFDELEYFTSLTSLPNTAFYGCSSLASITLPSSVSALGNGSFYNCFNLATMTLYAETPPTVGTNAFKNVPTSIIVHVPCGDYNAYHTANGWSEFITVMEFGVCPIVFADPDVKALCVANWDTNGDGELSYDEAAAVTNLGMVFNYNSSITSFNELQYFINLTSIGNSVFSGCTSLTSIVIPNSVISIGNYAFQACTSLTSIEIPSSLTSIGNYAFINCISLTSIEIPNSVTLIGNYAFSSCGSLISIEIPSSVSSVGTNPFIGCTDLEQIVVASDNIYYDSRENCNAIIRTNINALVTGCKNTMIPNSVTSIGNCAFYNCNSLASIVIPNSVTSIGSSAFYNCSSLASIVIPNSVTSIDDNPFASCSGLEQIEVASDNAYYDSRENCNAIIRTNINVLVSGCKNTVIPNSMTLIANQAFEGCSSLASVEIPNSVTSIGSGAFSFCTSLTSVEIPNSVTSIGDGALGSCTSLTSVASFANTPPTLGNNVFYSVNKTIPMYVPCGASDAYQSTNGWNEFTNIMGMCPGTITVAALPTEGGTVSGGGLYEGGGTTCTLTATPNHDYHFLNWTENGEVVSSEAEYTFLVAGDRNLMANFSFTHPAPVVAEYYPDPNEPNSPYVKVHWAVGPYESMIGDVNSTINTTYMPFYTYYNYSISEALYKTNELIGSGATAGLITSLSWEAIEVTTIQPQNNISIWMANVPDTELTTTSHLANNMTLVYTGNIGIPPLGWNEFVFNESNFIWDGTSNILILCQRNNGQWNGRVRWRSHNPGFYGMAYVYQDHAPYNAATQTYALTLCNTARPNIIMKGEGSMTYNIYRADCDGTNTQLLAENLSDSQFIDETWLQLENDSYKYGVSFADSTSTDIFWSNCIEKQGDVAVQTITLSSGTNWFSTYVEITLDDLKAALETATPNTAITVQSQTQNTSYNPNNHRWTGRLTALDLSKMYKITVAASCEITLTGSLINPANHPVTISTGSNWIAFPIDENMTPTEAFAGFAVNGDVLQSQTNNANYRNNRWVGQVNTLEPGKGYIYRSSESDDRIFVFPQGRANQGLPSGLR